MYGDAARRIQIEAIRKNVRFTQIPPSDVPGGGGVERRGIYLRSSKRTMRGEYEVTGACIDEERKLHPKLNEVSLKSPETFVNGG